MVRDSLIGPHSRGPFTSGDPSIEENAPSKSSGSLSTSQSAQLLSSTRAETRSKLSISRISINSPLSSLNLAQVDPADLPPPLVIDRQNRLVTDPRSARSSSINDSEHSENSSDGTATPTPRQRKASTTSKPPQYGNDDISTIEPMSVLSQIMEASEAKTSKRDSKSDRNSGAKLVEQNYLKVVYGTKSTKNVYKKDAEGHWELIGKGEPKVEESYDAAERARKRARKKAISESKAQAKAITKAATEEQKKQKKEVERRARVDHMAAKGVEDDPWALMTTGLPRKSKVKDTEAAKAPTNSVYPQPPLRSPPEIPQHESFIPAITRDLFVTKRGWKESEMDEAVTVQDVVSINNDFPDLALSVYEKDINGKSSFVSVPRNRPSSAGRFLSRNKSATDITHEAAPRAVTLPSRASHQRGRHQSLWINGEERTTPQSLDQLKMDDGSSPDGNKEATVTPPSAQGFTNRLWSDLSSKSRDSSSKDKKSSTKGGKGGGGDCLSTFIGSDPLDENDDESVKEYTPAEEKARRQNFPAFKNCELRKRLGCEKHVHAPGMGPKHRKHERLWHSRNLWCAGPGCTGTCHCCGRSCCAYFEYMQRMADQGNMDSKNEVREVIGAIQLWEGSARENGTFMECTECHRLTCPFCCGICPTEMCQDLQCIKCKDNPWAACDWHDKLNL